MVRLSLGSIIYSEKSARTLLHVLYLYSPFRRFNIGSLVRTIEELSGLFSSDKRPNTLKPVETVLS